MNYDVINGIFEAVGAVATWRNYLAIRRDRAIRGVDWKAMAFFTGWGLWNLVFYPHLHQWWSTVGGIALVAGNVSWVSVAIRLQLQERARVRNAQTSVGQLLTGPYGDLVSSTKSSEP